MSSTNSAILTGLVHILAEIPQMDRADVRFSLLSNGFTPSERSIIIAKRSDDMLTDLISIVNLAADLGKLSEIIDNAKIRPQSQESRNRLNVILSRLSGEQQQNENDYPQDSSTETTMLGKFKYDIFISHASEDKPIIEQLIQEFKRAGVTYWVDHEQIDFGDRITEKIEEGLRESKYVVVCLSANLGRSNWVRAEYGSILHKELGRSSQGSGRKVIPLKLDDSSDDNIPLLLYNKRRANYSNVTEFNQLLEFLKC